MKIYLARLVCFVAVATMSKEASAAWEPCMSSSDCHEPTSCCTAKYSSGILKCTPLGACFDPSENGCVGATTKNHHQDGSCKMEGSSIKTTKWSCYQKDPIVFKGSVDIWWGHEAKDGAWACDEQIGDCKSTGGCRAIKYSTENTIGEVTVQGAGNCVGNGGTCTAVYSADYSITINNFRNDDTHEKVEGCGGAFALTSLGFESDGKTVTGSAGFGQGKVYQGWEGCCGAAGDALEKRGLLSSGWKCAKDWPVATGIWLLGKNKCWSGGSHCGALCDNCCNGYTYYFPGGNYCN